MSEIDNIKARLQSTWTAEASQIESNIDRGFARPEDYAQLVILYSIMEKDKKEIKEAAEKAIKVVQQDLASGNITAQNYVSLARVSSTISNITDKKTAEKYYNSALEISPNCIDALTGLANLFSCSLDSNDKRKALGYLTRALEIEPDGAYLYEDRAILKVTLGEYDSALEDLEKILELNPDENMKESVLKHIEIVKEEKRSGRFNSSSFKSSDFNPDGLQYKDTPIARLFTIAIITAGLLYLFYEFFIVK